MHNIFLPAVCPVVCVLGADQLDEGTVFVNGNTANNDEDIINAAPAFGINNETAVVELLTYYPTAPEYGSPYNTGNQTFGQGAQYKRFASLYGDYAFQVSNITSIHQPNFQLTYRRAPAAIISKRLLSLVFKSGESRFYLCHTERCTEII